MPNFIRTYAGRIAGAVAAVLATLLVGWGIDISPETIAGFEAFLEAFLVGAALLAYGMIHKFIDGLLKRKPDES